MAEKRDYYEVLGISKSASADEIKRLKNITLMSIRNLEQKKSLKKFRKPMMFYLMTIKKLPTIVMVMLHLIKLVDSVEEPEALADLVALKMLT